LLAEGRRRGIIAREHGRAPFGDAQRPGRNRSAVSGPPSPGSGPDHAATAPCRGHIRRTLSSFPAGMATLSAASLITFLVPCQVTLVCRLAWSAIGPSGRQIQPARCSI